MSTILKALRRLEEERTPSGSRPLREEVATTPDLPGGRLERRWLPALAVVAGLGLIGAVAWSQWPLGATEAAETDVAAQAVVQPAPAATPEPAASPRRPAAPLPRAQRRAPPPLAERRSPPAAPSQAGLPDQAFSSDVEVVQRPPVTPRAPMHYARASNPMPDPEPSAAAPEPAAARPEPEVAVVAKVPARQPTPAAKPPVPKPAPVVAKTLAPKPAPTIEKRAAPKPAPAVEKAPAPKPAPVAEKSQTPKPAAVLAKADPPRPAPAVKPDPAPAKAAPSAPAPPKPAAEPLRVEKTLWHPTPDRRVAFVALGDADARRVQEGDVVGRHVVSEIQPSGVLFLDGGKRLHRKIGAK